MESFAELSNSLDLVLSDDIDLGASFMLPKEKVLRELHSPEFRAETPAKRNDDAPPASTEKVAPETSEKTVAVPPDDLRLFCDRTALYIARGGPALEATIKAKEANNPTFRFLDKADVFYPYYAEKLRLALVAAPKPEELVLEISNDYRIDLSRDVLLVSNGRFNEPLADALALDDQQEQLKQQSEQEPKPETPILHEPANPEFDKGKGEMFVSQSSLSASSAAEIDVAQRPAPFVERSYHSSDSSTADAVGQAHEATADPAQVASADAVVGVEEEKEKILQSATSVSVDVVLESQPVEPSVPVPAAAASQLVSSADSREVSDSASSVLAGSVDGAVAPPPPERDLGLSALVVETTTAAVMGAIAEDEFVPPQVPPGNDELDEEGWQVVKPELLVDVIASRSGDYEAMEMATVPPPKVRVKLHEANTMMAAWCNSETWTNSKMENNEWAYLPVLVRKFVGFFFSLHFL